IGAVEPVAFPTQNDEAPTAAGVVVATRAALVVRVVVEVLVAVLVPFFVVAAIAVAVFGAIAVMILMVVMVAITSVRGGPLVFEALEPFPVFARLDAVLFQTLRSVLILFVFLALFLIRH
ncbi:MAG: hypothetical protein GY741_15905, partial [Phycisphaeraceae bacterium]|nr:hypothetical protein [Phycisphaeraceae bacterium]